MDFRLLCNPIRARVSEQLAFARSQDEKAFLLRQTLLESGVSVLEALNAAAASKAVDPSSYQMAQSVVSEFLTFIVLPYTSCGSNHKEAVAVLEELAAVTTDEVIRKKLVIYTSQMKRRWLEADPSALAINPRGAKARPGKAKPEWTVGLILVLFFFSVIYLFFNRGSSSPEPQSGANQPVSIQQAPRLETPVPPPVKDLAPDGPAVDPASPSKPVSDGYFKYTDSKGVIHLGNGEKPTPPNSPIPAHATPVVIRGNQVLVPVVLSYHGRSVKTTLLLDTGATVTTINERVASMLEVNPADVHEGTATVADGRSVSSGFFVADWLQTGSKRVGRIRTGVLPGSGGSGYDGLLGMDFLKNFRYHVDFRRSVIDWGG